MSASSRKRRNCCNAAKRRTGSQNPKCSERVKPACDALKSDGYVAQRVLQRNKNLSAGGKRNNADRNYIQAKSANKAYTIWRPPQVGNAAEFQVRRSVLPDRV